MDKKVRLIAIVLAALCLGAIGLAFSYINRYKDLTRDYHQLEQAKSVLTQENNKLTQKAAELREEVSRQNEKQSQMQLELDRQASENDDLQRRYNKLTEERDKLIARIEKAIAKSSYEEMAAGLPGIQEPAGDEYWAKMLRQKEDLEAQLAKLKDTSKDNQLKMSELTKEKAEYDLEIKELTKEKTELQRQLEYNEKMTDSFSLQLVREKDDKRKLSKQLKLLREENYAMRSSLKGLMSNKLSLEKRLKDTEDKRLDLYNRVNKMDQLLQDKLSAVIDTKQDLSDIKRGALPLSGSTVELSPIVVHPGSARSAEGDFVQETPAGKETPGVKERPAQKEAPVMATHQDSILKPEGIKGSIRAVNEANNFVILDIGEKQGVRKGQFFQVYRDGRQIAVLEVIKVSLNVSAADIKEANAPIKAADTVK